MYIYTVKPGDTLFDIAQKNGVTISALVAANQLSDPYKLPVGLALVISGQSIRERSIVVNGYAFPGISDIALLGALQYLTYLSVFSAKTRIDGTITELNDTALIRKCYVNGVAPVLTLTNQRESGGFSGDIAHAVIADEEVKTKLIQNVMEYLDRRNYFGLNIDFEYVREEDRTLYTQFLLDFAAALRRVGYSFSVAIAPKISQEQSGLLYTAHDYGAVGSIADKVIIMTYEWGYTYGEPMAVAPIDKVRQVLDYAVMEMPPEKILMGMANYGYSWTLPYKKGTAARPLSLSEIPQTAYSQYADIRFDDTAQSPFFRYYDSAGTEHIAWFEDTRSIEAKLKLVSEYGLGGVSYWNINTLYRPNWAVLSGMYGIEKVFGQG